METIRTHMPHLLVEVQPKHTSHEERGRQRIGAVFDVLRFVLRTNAMLCEFMFPFTILKGGFVGVGNCWRWVINFPCRYELGYTVYYIPWDRIKYEPPYGKSPCRIF